MQMAWVLAGLGTDLHGSLDVATLLFRTVLRMWAVACQWASMAGSHSEHEHWDRQVLVGRENSIWWIQFMALMFPDFSV